MNLLKSNLTGIKFLYYFNFFIVFTFLIFNDIRWLLMLFSIFIFFLMNPLGIAITYHRYWTHNSFKFKNKFLLYFCSVPPLVSGVGSIIGWVGMHRRHHKFSDKIGDPHLASKGIFNMIAMRSYEYNANPKEIMDLLRNKFAVLTHNYYFLFPCVYVLICILFFGMNGLFYGYCLPAFASLFVQNLTNFFNHFDNGKYLATNVWWINFFNFGDGWHKNHHENQSNYTTQKEKIQLDPAGWLIKYIFGKNKNNA